MTEITQEGWKNKALSMLLAQLTSYVLFIAATVIPSPGTVPIIPLIIAALTLAAFVVFWPFRGSILDRIVTLVFGVTSGVAALAVAGWCFLPDLGAMLAKGTVAGTVALIILIVLALALAVASTLWVRDADPDPDIRYPWIGTGLMPVMLMGVTIAATALVLGRIIG